MHGALSVAPGHARLDRESAQWLSALEGSGVARERALARLHALLLHVARAEAGRRAPKLEVSADELDDLAQQAADEATPTIVATLDDFRGDSRFTTWAYKFAVLGVASKLTRHAWRGAAPVRDETWMRLPDRFGFAPAEAAESRELFAGMRRAAERDLTLREQRIFVAVVLQGVPLDVLVEQLRSSRDAIYRSLFDARIKLRARLAAKGCLDSGASGRP